MKITVSRLVCNEVNLGLRAQVSKKSCRGKELGYNLDAFLGLDSNHGLHIRRILGYNGLDLEPLRSGYSLLKEATVSLM